VIDMPRSELGGTESTPAALRFQNIGDVLFAVAAVRSFPPGAPVSCVRSKGLGIGFAVPTLLLG
jgi:hypothetical protein